MERKAFHALLLSLAVIAGAVTITTDAYAQTNTERLITVVDNTNEANSLLSDLLDAVTNGFAQVLEMLGAVDGDLQDIHGDLSAIDGDLQAIHDDLTTVHADLEALDGDIQAVANTVGGLGAAASAITSLNQGITANAAAISALDEKLDMISMAVGAVEDAVAVSADGTTTALSELHSIEVEYDVPVSAFGNNKPADATYKADLKLTCESPVFIDRVDTQYTDTAPTASDTVGVFAQDTATPITAEASVIADGTTVYDTQFEIGGTNALYRNGASFTLAELAAGSSLTIKLSTDRTTALIDSTVNNTFSIQTYLMTNARDRVAADNAGVTTNPPGTDGTNQTKAEAGKRTVITLTADLYSSAEDPKCTVTPPAGPSVDYTQTDETVSFAINAREGEDRSIKTINDATFTCSGATAITKVTVEGGLIADFRTFVDLTITADTSTSLNFDKVGDALEATLEDPLEITSGMVTIAGKIPGSAALVSVTYDTVANAKCSVPTS